MVVPVARVSRAVGAAGRGSALEALLEWQHEQYERRGVARIVKVPTPFVVRGWDGRAFARAHPARKATVDYLGCLVPSGRMVAVEAKSTAADRWHPSAIPEHQRAELDLWAAAGALALVVLGWESRGGIDAVWVIPWPAVRRRIRERRSWSRASPEDGPAVVAVGRAGAPADYLAAAAPFS